jgi:hypothetical protein
LVKTPARLPPIRLRAVTRARLIKLAVIHIQWRSPLPHQGKTAQMDYEDLKSPKRSLMGKADAA